MKIKRNIAVVLACVLLASLGAAMIFGGCGKEDKTDAASFVVHADTDAQTENCHDQITEDVLDIGPQTALFLFHGEPPG